MVTNLLEDAKKPESLQVGRGNSTTVIIGHNMEVLQKKLKIELLYDSTILLLGIYSKEAKSASLHTDSIREMNITVLHQL